MEVWVNAFKMLQGVGASGHAEILALAGERSIMLTMLNFLFWVFVLILALSYFGISIEAIINSPAGQANFAYLGHLLSQLWQWIQTYIQQHPF